MYFTFFDYTTQTTQVPFVGPVVSYAKYVKDKQGTIGQGNRSADGLLAAVLGMKNAAENYSSTMRVHAVDEDVVIAERVDGGSGRHMRLYPTVHRPPPVYLPTSSESFGHRNVDVDKYYYRGTLGYSTDGLYGFGRRSDFPQLSAYRAPFPPKSVLAVMKYVTGSSPSQPYRTVDVADHMIAQESKTRYVPAVRPAEEVNRFLPDANALPTSVGSKRFRNKFGPPMYLQPPVVAFPDDFMKPPNPGARFSMNFDNDVLPDGVLHAGSSNVPLHTDAVFHSSSEHSYLVPDTPSPKRVKTKRTKSKKPNSVMLDIYPISDHEHENEQGQCASCTLLKNSSVHRSKRLYIRIFYFFWLAVHRYNTIVRTNAEHRSVLVLFDSGKRFFEESLTFKIVYIVW